MSFLLPLQILAPTICYLCLGYLFKCFHLADETAFRSLSRIAMRGLVSVNIFYSIYTADFSAEFDPLLIGCAITAILISAGLAVLIVPRIITNGPTAASAIQGIFRGNFVIFGLSMVRSAYGNDAIATAAILVAFAIPTYNLLVVVLFECFRGKKPSYKTIAINTAKNPLIVAAIVGILFNLSGFDMPDILRNIVSDIGSVGTPMILIGLGGTFTFAGFQRNMKKIAAVSFCKLFLMPAVFLPIFIALGFRDVKLLCLVAILATPTASSSAAMAQEYGGDATLAGDIVVSTTALSIVTVFLWISVLSTFHLL